MNNNESNLNSIWNKIKIIRIFLGNGGGGGGRVNGGGKNGGGNVNGGFGGGQGGGSVNGGFGGGQGGGSGPGGAQMDPIDMLRMAVPGIQLLIVMYPLWD